MSYKNGEKEQPSARYGGVACNPVTPKQDCCQLEANPGSWGAEAQLGLHGKDSILEVSNFLCPPYQDELRIDILSKLARHALRARIFRF